MTRQELLEFEIQTSLARLPSYHGFGLSQEKVKKVFAHASPIERIQRAWQWSQEKFLGRSSSASPPVVYEKLGQMCVKNGWVFTEAHSNFIFYTLAAAQSWDSVRTGEKTIVNGRHQ